MAGDEIWLPRTPLFAPASYAEAAAREAAEDASGNEDIYEAPANSAQQFVVRPSTVDLGLEPISLPELRADAERVAFDAGFIGMSLIAGRLWNIWQDGAKQLELQVRSSETLRSWRDTADSLTGSHAAYCSLNSSCSSRSDS